MSTLVIGFAFIFLVVASSVGVQFKNFLEFQSIALVMGGTLAILFASTPTEGLRSLWRAFKALMTPPEHIDQYRTIITTLSQNRTSRPTTNQPLITYAVDLWQQGLGPDLFTVLLSQKLKDLEAHGLDGIQALKNLVKYPPALGMAGTVIGMVHLFSTLDQNKEGIGNALSLAMTSTFLGLITTNFLIAPLADRLQVQQVSKERLNQNLFEILLLINQGQPPTLVKEELDDRAA
jgi:chemotaxis protein MotA